MLTTKGRSVIDHLMSWGCALKIYPFIWDQEKFRLKKASTWQLIYFNARLLLNLIATSFIILRFLQTLKQPSISSRIRIMNFIWGIAFSLATICFVQLKVRRGAILLFANALLAKIDGGSPGSSGKELEPLMEKNLSSVEAATNSITKENTKNSAKISEQNRKHQEQKINWISLFVIISGSLLLMNPTAHSTVLLDIPCAPQYMSSLVLDCSSIENRGPILYRLGFLVLETIIIADVMFAWTICWIFSFLGFNWIKSEMNEFERITQNKSPCTIVALDSVLTQYRYAQSLVAILNDAFEYYLSYFPTIFFTVAAMLLFGAIRYTALPFHAYWVFPVCGVRCIFEAGSALAAAGYINQQSKLFLKQWDHALEQTCAHLYYGAAGTSVQGQGVEGGDDVVNAEGEPMQSLIKYLKVCRKSCHVLNCRAGGFYSFEHSIFLACMGACINLTMTMVVTFK